METERKYELVVYWSPDDDAFVLEVPDLPGCAGHGASRVDTVGQIEQAIELWLATTRIGSADSGTRGSHRQSSGAELTRSDLPASPGFCGRPLHLLPGDLFEQFAAAVRYHRPHFSRVSCPSNAVTLSPGARDPDAVSNTRQPRMF